MPIKRLLVLSNGPSPTFTYYLEERLKRATFPVTVHYLWESISETDPEGVFVIICRYMGPRQLRWLWRNRRSLAGISLLIDDDIAATVSSKGGSLSYKIYLSMLGIVALPFLNRILSDIWVSTPYLAEKLGQRMGQDPVVLPPFPPPEAYTPLPARDDGKKITMAFHTTGSHDSEHVFLIPIVRNSMLLCPKLHFEVRTSSRKLRKAWEKAGLPPERFCIKPTKRWIEYLDETRCQPINILLVPLLRSAVNDARSDTKRFDTARMGAAAIFSRGHVYGPSAVTGEILVENEPDSWVENILRLACNAELRLQVTSATNEAIRASLVRATSVLPLHA